jgi:phage-related protein
MTDGPLPSTRRPLSLVAALDKSNLDSADPVLMLAEITIFDIETGVPSGDVIRLVNAPQSVSTTEEDANGVTFQGNYYQPASFDVQLKEASGQIPEVTLGVHDITGIIRTYMDIYQGGVTSTVRLLVVWQSALSSGRAELAETFEIIGASIADRDATLTLGAPNLLAISFPRRRQTRNFCQWQYKGIECAYAGSLPDCDRTLKGDNGCEVHLNTPNFGGFPGIQPRNFVR